MAWSKPQKPVCLAILLLTNQLPRFPAPAPFSFVCFCHAFSVNRYLRNSPERNLACWIINLLLDVFLCSIAEHFYEDICLFAPKILQQQQRPSPLVTSSTSLRWAFSPNHMRRNATIVTFLVGSKAKEMTSENQKPAHFSSCYF